MADSKITALTAISTVDPTADPLVIVDVSDTSMAASGTTKKSTINQLLGSGGTATLASATITGDLTVDTSTLKVDSANNRVGIGTASPAYLAHIRSTSPVLTIQDDTSAAGGVGGTLNFIAFTSGTSGANIEAQIKGVKSSASSAGELQFFTSDSSGNSVQRFMVDGSGNLGLGVTPSAGKGCLQLSSGINFPATQVASSDANTLDDYEEGTWTPGLSFGGGVVGITYSTNTGKYTKIGRQVTVSAFIDLSSKGSSTGNVLITGLPFSIGTGDSNYAAASIAIIRIAFADYPMAIGIVGTGNIEIQEVTNAGVRTNLTDADFANNSQIILSFTYTV